MANKKENEIPIIPAKEVPSLEKRIFLSIIKDIDKTEIIAEQKVVIFDVMIEGFKTALYLIYEFEKTLLKEKISAIDKEYKIASYIYGLNVTMLKFDKLFYYTGYEKTRDNKSIEIAIKSAILVLDIFAEAEGEWGNPWDWNSEYIKDTKSYFIGIKDALDKFREIVDYMIDYLHTYAMFCPECGKIKYEDYFELFSYGINRISNIYPTKIEIIADVINDIDLIKKKEYISKEYLWKDIKAYIEEKVF